MAFSFSQINLYETCQKKYRFRYIDKLSPDFDDTIQMFFGTTIHSCLEYLYKNQNISCEKLVSFFEYIWQKKHSQIKEKNIKVVGLERFDEYTQIGKQILKNFFDSKSKFFWKTKILGLETAISFSLWNIKYNGFIDRIESQWNKIFIVDYKTNVSIPSSDYHKKQIEFYALAWKNQKKIDAEFFGVLEYIRLWETKIWKIETDFFEQEKFFENIAVEILNKKWEYEYWDLEIFVPNVWEKCKGCEFLSFCNEGKNYIWFVDK